MRKLLLLALFAAGCDGSARGPCAAGGQVLGDCGTVSTPEDACWKLVDCGVIPVKDPNGPIDWGGCVDHIDALDADSQDVAVQCVDAASCDQLVIPGNNQWPDCLEYPQPP